MKIVVTFHLALDGMQKMEAHRSAHDARIRTFHDRGSLLLAGDFANPEEGAMCIFTSRAAADEFIMEDPFVNRGVYGKWIVRELNEIVF